MWDFINDEAQELRFNWLCEDKVKQDNRIGRAFPIMPQRMRMHYQENLCDEQTNLEI